MQEVIRNLATAKQISLDAATAAVLSENPTGLESVPSGMSG